MVGPKSHCKRGHRLTAKTYKTYYRLRYRRDGTTYHSIARLCRHCANENKAAYLQRKAIRCDTQSPQQS